MLENGTNGTSAQPRPLRERLAGAWHLESYVAHPASPDSKARPIHPMTKSVAGIILYTSDGYMSAQMLIPGQKPFKLGEANSEQWAEAGRRYMGYTGPFYITEEHGKEVLRHSMQVSNMPGSVGDIQIRDWRFEEDGQVLVLGNDEPTPIKVHPSCVGCMNRQTQSTANTSAREN